MSQLKTNVVKKKYQYMIYNKFDPTQYIAGYVSAESMDVATCLVNDIIAANSNGYKIRSIELVENHD